MSVINSIWPFVAVIFVLVAVHEGGHFLAARALGIAVTDFAVGMGPEVAGVTRRGIRYSLRLLPIGGYVKFFGGDNPAQRERVARDRIDERRGSVFLLAPAWRRATVIAAGPGANLLFAIALIAGLYMTVGRPETSNVIAGVEQGSPAAAAGLQAGDRIMFIDGRSIERFGDIEQSVLPAPGRSLVIRYEREGRERSVVVTPAAVGGTVYGRPATVGHIGVASGETVLTVLPAWPAAAAAARDAYALASNTLAGLGRIATGRDSPQTLGGPVKIAQISAHVVNDGLVQATYFLAVISIGLAIFNSLPLPILDGGYLLLYAAEAVVRRPPPASAINALGRAGAVAIITLMIYVTYHDIVVLLGVA